MPSIAERARLARDGIFNLRDLGGIPLVGGRVVRARKVLRADALHRAKGSSQVLRDLGVVRVLDLRDEVERDEEGVLAADGLEVQHHPVIDPMFEWFHDEVPEPGALLAHRYREILTAFGPRFATALTSLAEVIEPQNPGAVAYHCAVGKDRTGLLTALLLGVLGAGDDAIVADYARSAAASPVQVSWLWSLGHPAGAATDDDIFLGLWSARPQTMRVTLQWISDEFGGVGGYVAQTGIADGVVDSLRAALVADGGDRVTSAPGASDQEEANAVDR